MNGHADDTVALHLIKESKMSWRKVCTLIEDIKELTLIYGTILGEKLSQVLYLLDNYGEHYFVLFYGDVSPLYRLIVVPYYPRSQIYSSLPTLKWVPSKRNLVEICVRTRDTLYRPETDPTGP